VIRWPLRLGYADRVPAGFGLIDRDDLVAALDKAARKRVTVISAPAGSGKTSLLRAWASRPGPDHRPGPDRRIAFMSVRAGQHDRQQFWLALLDAVRAAAGHTAPQAAAPGFDGPAMARKALGELAANGQSVVLIIDDLHELASAEATEQLRTLLASLPDNVHAVLATRRDLPLRLHQLRLAGELAEIRAAQLRFTENETRDLLAAAGIILPGPVMTSLYQRTEGWAAGLRLAALSLGGHPDPERFVAEFSGSDRTVAEYLLAEMLDRQPPEVRRLLLRTSVLERVNGELADLLAGATGSGRILLDLEDANAFVLSLDPDRTWFRYHHMFAGLLQLELRHTRPEDIPELHRRAARWFADHGEIAEAIRHRQAAGDWAEAARLLTDHAVGLTLDGQAGTVAGLLRSFPAPTSEYFPGLALVHAIVDLDQLHLDQADAHLDLARVYAGTTQPARRHRLRLAIATLDLLSARLRGHFDGVYEQVDAIGSLAADRSSADVALSRDLKAVALLNLGVAEAWSLRLADSERHLAEGAAVARDIGRPYLEVACLAHLGFAATIHSFDLARRRSEEAIVVAARHGWDAEPVIAPALAALANALIWTGQFGPGEQWLDRARNGTQSDGEPGIRLLVGLTSGMLQAARGYHREALAEFAAARQMQALMLGEHALTSRITAWTIATQARLGQVELARSTLAALGEHLAVTGEIRNAAAVIHLAGRDPAAARRELTPVLDDTAPVHSYLTQVEAHILDGLAARDLGDERATRAAVEQSLHLAEPDRLILPFAMTGGWKLLIALPSLDTAHAALIADILDTVRGGGAVHAAAGPSGELSPSELRVLRFLPTNLTRYEIAGELSVSPNTVSTHIRRIYAKLGATDRSAAVRRGRELRLLSSGRGGATTSRGRATTSGS
jgi:LuxR family maltose regulon positive regulatory protein